MGRIAIVGYWPKPVSAYQQGRAGELARPCS